MRGRMPFSQRLGLEMRGELDEERIYNLLP
jgi:hypothetical protein